MDGDTNPTDTGPGGRSRTVAIVLAGGEGKRLYPLTRDRAKPAVPFGGVYRLIDFALSNLANAGIRRIFVLTQYKSHSLNRHLALAWSFSAVVGDFVAPVPAQMRTGPRWFAGSADAIYQNLNVIDDESPEHVVVLGADHIYRMDPRQILDGHVRTGAGVTVVGIPVPLSAASGFGIIDASDGTRIRGFEEKPEHPQPMRGDPTRALASTGNYVFTADVLKTAVMADASSEPSSHDVGRDLIPALVAAGDAHVYDFGQHVVPGQGADERGYWRDVGTLDNYYAASMDLLAARSEFDLHNARWPVLTWQPAAPPAKFVHADGHVTGQIDDSLVANGVVVSGATVRGSILSPGVRVFAGALVEDSVLFDGVQVGEGAIVRRAIVDKHVRIPAGYEIGTDPGRDRRRFTCSGAGVVAIGKHQTLE